MDKNINDSYGARASQIEESNALMQICNAEKNFDIPLFIEIMESYRIQMERTLRNILNIPRNEATITCSFHIMPLRKFVDQIEDNSSLKCADYQFCSNIDRGWAVFIAPNSTLRYWVASMLNAGSTDSIVDILESTINRELTDIENLLVIGVFDSISNCFSDAFRTVANSNISSLIREVQYARSGLPSVHEIQSVILDDINYIMQVDIHSKDGIFPYYFSVPYFAIEYLRTVNLSALQNISANENSIMSSEWNKYMKDVLNDVVIDMRINFPKRYTALADLDKMKEGIVIRMNATADSDVCIDMNGATLGVGEIGTVGNNMAVKIKQISNDSYLFD